MIVRVGLLIVYGDILFLENLIMNFFILMVTERFTKCRTSSLRLFFGAMIGASYVIFMLVLPDMKVFGTVIAKLLLSAAIVAISFHIQKLSVFFKILIVFYVSTFLFAGAALAFTYFIQGGGILMNGILWPVDGKMNIILMAAGLVVILVRVFREILQPRLVRDKLLVRLIIAFDSRTTGIYALVDTGNSLHDPLTNMPVVVVEFNAIRGILPAEIQKIFEEYRENDLSGITEAITGSTWFSRFRLIPFTSLGKENGMLIGFRPDYIEINKDNDNKGIRDVIVGIYGSSLSKNEKYRALLSPELM